MSLLGLDQVLPKLCAAMAVVRLDRGRQLHLPHHAPLYVLLEVGR